MTSIYKRVHLITLLAATLLTVVGCGPGAPQFIPGTFDGEAARNPINNVLPNTLPDEAGELFYSYQGSEGGDVGVVIFSLPAAQAGAYLADNAFCITMPLEESDNTDIARGQCSEYGMVYTLTVDRSAPDVHVIQYGFLNE